MSVESEVINDIKRRLQAAGAGSVFSVTFDAVGDRWEYCVDYVRQFHKTWTELVKDLNHIVGEAEEENKKNFIPPEEIERLKGVIQHYKEHRVVEIRTQSNLDNLLLNFLLLDNHGTYILPYYTADNKEYIDIVKGYYLTEGAKYSLLTIGNEHIHLQVKRWSVIEEEIRSALVKLAKLGDK